MPDDVIMSPDRRAVARADGDGLFPGGNLAPEGSVIKSTAIDPIAGWTRMVCIGNRGPARVFTTEAAAIAAIKKGEIGQGDVIVLICAARWARGCRRLTRSRRR